MSGHSAEPWFVEPYCDSDRAEIHSGERTTEALEHPEGGDYVTSPVVLAYKVLPLKADANRIAACVNACRGLNPEHVPELVAMVEKLQLALGIFLTGEQQPSAYIKQKTLDVYQEGLELLAKIKPTADPNPSPR